MSDTLFHLLLTATWQSMFLAMIVLLVTLTLRERLQPRFCYLLWCVVLIRLALPILPATPWGVFPFQTPWGALPVEQTTVSTAFFPSREPFEQNHLPPIDPVSFAEPSTQKPLELNTHPIVTDKMTVTPIETTTVSQTAHRFQYVKTGVLAVWLLGIVFLAIRYAYDELCLSRQSRYWKPVRDPKLLTLFESCRKKLGIRRHVALLSVSHNIGAASSGFIRPKVLLSEKAIAEADEQKLSLVLLHELVHIKRNDPFVLRLAIILTLIHWLNPLVWFVLSRLQRERELACDAAVLHILGPEKQKEYGEAVLTFATLFAAQVRMPGLVGLFQKNAIARRIEMILKHKKSKFSYVLLGVTIVLAVAALGLTRAADKKMQTETTDQKEKTIPFQIEVPSMTELETGVFENTKAAYQKAYADLNGDITTGTFHQKSMLLWQTESLAHLYRQNGQMDEALRLMEDCKRYYVTLLKKVINQTENLDEKEGLLEIVSRTHDTFAMFGMYDDAIAVAKLSPYTSQYNASEYLTRVANIMGSKEPFDKVIPILDEAIIAAKNLPDLFWQESAIIDVAELYAKAGHLKKADELAHSMSNYGNSRGLVAIAKIVIKKSGDETSILALLKESEKIAEKISNQDDQSSAFTIIAETYIMFGKYDEGMRVFEKSTWTDDPLQRDNILIQIIYDLTVRKNLNEAEVSVEKLHSKESKGRALMYILREASIQGDISMMKHLIPIAEPYLLEMEPFAHRLQNQLYLAAYKIKVGDVAAGQKMMDDLIAGPHVDGLLGRNDSISRAIGGLCYAGLYEEAVKKVETMTTLDSKASAYESIKSIYIQNEKPEENKKRLQHWEVRNDVPITMADDDIIIFADGKWKNEKTGVEIPVGTIVQGSNGTFRVEQEDEIGKVVALAGNAVSGEGFYVKVYNGGRAIDVSAVSFEIQKEFEEHGIGIGQDDVLVYDNGEWKNEKTGDVIPMGNLVAGTRGLFRLEQEDGEGIITLITGGGATGHGKYIRWSNGGNGFSGSKP